MCGPWLLCTGFVRWLFGCAFLVSDARSARQFLAAATACQVDDLPTRPLTHPPICRAGTVALPTIAMGLTVGQQAPAFTCAAHTGDTLSLSDFAGKKVLLWFYPRASTGG